MVNDTLSKNQQIKILNIKESSTHCSQNCFGDIEDDSKNISEVKEEECVECSFIKIGSLPESEETIDSRSKLIVDSCSRTDNSFSQEKR